MSDNPDMKVYHPNKRDMTEFEDHLRKIVKEEVGVNTTTKTKWWQVNPAQIFTMLVVLIGYGVTIGKTDARIAQTEAGLNAVVASATSTVIKIDANTRALDLDHATVLAHETRLSRLEDVNEKLAVIQTKAEQTSHDMTEMKNQVNNLSTAFTGFQIEFSKFQRK